MRVGKLKIQTTQNKPGVARFREVSDRPVAVTTPQLGNWLIGKFFKWSVITTGIVAGGALIGKLLSPIFNKIIDWLYEINKALKQS